MDMEMRADGHDVQFYNIQTGEVSSNGYPKTPGIMVPTARKYAKYALDKVGGERRDTPAYWLHALQLAMLSVIPSWMSEQTGVDMMRLNMEAERKGEKPP